MKKIFILLVAVLTASSVMAEGYPTKFLGIPIDGTKQEMKKKIMAKGFTYDPDHDCLTGQFNGSDVNVFIVTNGEKVWRVMVSESTFFSEREIRIRFNNLLRQFQKNKKYIPLQDKDFRLPEDEDISYEMAVHDKRYSAEFLQITHEIDTALIYSALTENLPKLGEEYGVELSLDSINEIDKQLLLQSTFNLACMYAFEKNQVWCLINEFYGRYFISIYYDNGYNRADGEDL